MNAVRLAVLPGNGFHPVVPVVASAKWANGIRPVSLAYRRDGGSDGRIHRREPRWFAIPKQDVSIVRHFAGLPDPGVDRPKKHSLTDALVNLRETRSAVRDAAAAVGGDYSQWGATPAEAKQLAGVALGAFVKVEFTAPGNLRAAGLADRHSSSIPLPFTSPSDHSASPTASTVRLFSNAATISSKGSDSAVDCAGRAK